MTQLYNQVKQAIAQQQDINQIINREQQTYLQVAATTGDIATVNLLLSQPGINPNIISKYRKGQTTALMNAVAKCNLPSIAKRVRNVFRQRSESYATTTTSPPPEPHGLMTPLKEVIMDFPANSGATCPTKKLPAMEKQNQSPPKTIEAWNSKAQAPQQSFFKRHFGKQ